MEANHKAKGGTKDMRPYKTRSRPAGTWKIRIQSGKRLVDLFFFGLLIKKKKEAGTRTTKEKK